MSGFGDCLECGGPVERAGWDSLCFRCQADEEAAADYTPCPGMGVDDLCAQAHGLDPLTDGCGLCTLGVSGGRSGRFGGNMHAAAARPGEHRGPC